MPRFWFGLGALCGEEAIRAQVDLDTASIAPTEVVSHPPDVDELEFDTHHPPPPPPAPACTCGFCANPKSLTIDGPIPLPIVIQFRYGKHRINATLERADDMEIMRGGKKSQYRQIIITRSGTQFENISSAAKFLLKLRSVNGTSDLNWSHSLIPLSRAPTPVHRF